jgi:hypothetical protein
MAGMATDLKLHARQFVLAHRAHMIGSDWQVRDIGHGWLLSHAPDLALEQSGTDLVIGHNVRLPGSEHPARAGRFCVIAYPLVQPDAAALLSLYFCHRDDGGFVTSSPALAQRLGAQHDPGRQLTWSGMNWNPLPGAPFKGVKRLLRDQVLDLDNFSLAFRPEAAVVPLAGMQAALQTLCDCLQAAAGGLAQDGQILLALTAGLDSRTLAAALLSSGVKFDCVTQNFAGVKKADIAVARDICRYLGVRHHVIEPVVTDNAAVHTWRQHTLASYSDADDNLLLNADQYRFLHKDTLLVRGGLFEIGRRFYQWKFPMLDFASATGERLFRFFEPTATDDRAIDTLNAWLQWRRTHDNGLDLVDSFYLDQRIGGWLAAIEQALDLLPGRSFQPVNSLPAMRALVTPSIDERLSGQLQKDAIRRMAPELLRFPVNPLSAFQNAKKLAHRFVSSMRALGGR